MTLSCPSVSLLFSKPPGALIHHAELPVVLAFSVAFSLGPGKVADEPCRCCRLGSFLMPTLNLALISFKNQVIMSCMTIRAIGTNIHVRCDQCLRTFFIHLFYLFVVMCLLMKKDTFVEH